MSGGLPGLPGKNVRLWRVAASIAVDRKSRSWPAFWRWRLRNCQNARPARLLLLLAPGSRGNRCRSCGTARESTYIRNRKIRRSCGAGQQPSAERSAWKNQRQEVRLLAPHSSRKSVRCPRSIRFLHLSAGRAWLAIPIHILKDHSARRASAQSALGHQSQTRWEARRCHRNRF